MNAGELILFIVSIGMFIYLGYALFKAERF